MASVSHTASTAATPRPHIWAWPLTALLGFPIGGEIANVVVGPVDSVGPALAGGLIAGAVIGAAQWFALRRLVPRVWIAATSVGMAVGLPPRPALFRQRVSRGKLR